MGKTRPFRKVLSSFSFGYSDATDAAVNFSGGFRIRHSD
jgi:hypothetical protein